MSGDFDPDMVIETIKKEKVTHTILVPSQIISCLQHKDFTGEKLSSLEYVLSVGAPLLQEHKEKIEKQLPGIFYELYGLTEGFMTVLDKNDFKNVPVYKILPANKDMFLTVPAGSLPGNRQSFYLSITAISKTNNESE